MRLREFYRKAALFSKEYLQYIFFYNYHLRPKGSYPDVKSFLDQQTDQHIFFKEIYAPSKSNLEIPDEIWKYQSSNLSLSRKSVQGPKFIVKVYNARIYTDCHKTIAIISEDNKVIGDISVDLSLKNNDTIAKSRIFKRKYFPKVKHIDGTVYPIVAGGGSYINYYHWLIDAVSRIHFIKSAGLFEQVDWFYVPTVKYDYQLDSLKILGVPEEKIIESTKFPHIKADQILAPSYTRGKDYHVSDWVVDYLNEEFPPTDLSKYANGKYFISRRDSSIRTIINEDEVVDLLEKYGFETIILSELPFQDKVNLFASAKVIIGGSGAGLTNFIFAKPKTTVVEIFGDQFVDFVHYCGLAMKRKLNFHFYIGKNSKKTKSMKQGQKNNIRIDISSFDRFIENDLKLSAIHS